MDGEVTLANWTGKASFAYGTLILNGGIRGMRNYTDNSILSWVALGILCVLVWENRWIPKKEKKLYYLAYALIAGALLAEWVGLWLGGRDSFPKVALQVAKCLDYILSPMAGAALMTQMRLKNKVSRCMVVLLAVNTVFQVAAAFGGWMVQVDEHLQYVRGPLFGLYLALCVAVALLVTVQWVIFGRSFSRRNRVSLYAILGLFLLSFFMQEGLGAGSRTVYFGLTMGAALLFIHLMDYRQQAADVFLKSQELQLNTDPLTGLYSRYAYTQELKRYDAKGRVPKDMAVFLVDINDLKMVNDTFGHEAGDALIRAAAESLDKVFGKGGKCYRTGGDEFVVFVRLGREDAKAMLSRLEEVAGAWRGEGERCLHLAAGYALAADYPGERMEKLVSLADMAMYEAKRAYYEMHHGSSRKGFPQS